VSYHLLPTFLLEGFQEQQHVIAAQAEQLSRQQAINDAQAEQLPMCRRGSPPSRQCCFSGRRSRRPATAAERQQAAVGWFEARFAGTSP